MYNKNNRICFFVYSSVERVKISNTERKKVDELLDIFPFFFFLSLTLIVTIVIIV